MKLEKIQSKIQKLLSLAQSDNENEAKRAAEMASELMLKYNLNLQEIKEEKEYTESVINDGRKRKNSLDKYIIDLMGRYFFVKVLTLRTRTGYSISVMGTSENVESALYARDFLTATFKRLWKNYKSDNRLTEKSRDSYQYGLWLGFREQMEARKKKVEQETGLVVVKDYALDRYMASLHGPTYRGKAGARVHDRSAANQGAQDGRNIRIAKGVSSQSTGTRLALK